MKAYPLIMLTVMVWTSVAIAGDRLRSDDHWSYKPIRKPALPKVSGVVANPIDRFIIDRLSQQQLKPTPEADRRTLIRRVSFGVLGLGPSEAQVKAFAGTAGATAYERLVDDMLASPHFGERMARHWLDVVRYADTGGYEADIFYQHAWPYRDYVIRSFNQDKPFDRFVQEQIAGDELWPPGKDQPHVATAFWTLSPWPGGMEKYPEKLVYFRRTDRVDTLGEAFLGLSLGCARCHDHKYDPIRQVDYFGLQAVVAGSEQYDRNTGKQYWKKHTDKRRFAQHLALRHEADTTVHLLRRGELDLKQQPVGPALPASLPGGGPLVGQGANDHTKRRTALAKWLTAKNNPLLARVIVNRLWQWHFGRGLVATPNDLGRQGAAPTHPQLLDWLAGELIANGYQLKPIHRLILTSATYKRASRGGDPATQAKDPENRFLWRASRRRMEMEIVWDQIHATAGTLNLKMFGEPVSIPLTNEEKSAQYKKPPEGGGSVTKDKNEWTRRAIYLIRRRTFRIPFFEAFDPPNNGSSCPVRGSTTAPTQALTLLNNQMVLDQARAFAGRLINERDDEAGRLTRAWALAYGRPMTAVERSLAAGFLKDRTAALSTEKKKVSAAGVKDKRRVSLDRAAAWVELCLAIFNTNEFIYVD